jgi:hypothetical protein
MFWSHNYGICVKSVVFVTPPKLQQQNGLDSDMRASLFISQSIIDIFVQDAWPKKSPLHT